MRDNFIADEDDEIMDDLCEEPAVNQITFDDLRIGETAPGIRKDLELLTKKYEGLFSARLEDVGSLKGAEFEINLKPGSQPCFTPAYSSAYRHYEEFKKQIDNCLKQKIIRKAKGARFQSAVIFVPKPGGEWRMCIDFRKLNAMTIQEIYQMPLIADLYHKFLGKTVFSSLDMRAGYHHIPIKETDRHKTAFCTPWGTYEWNVMAFGFMNAPSYFQKYMDNLFDDMRHCVVVYIDDIFIFSDNDVEHLQHLEEVFRRLKSVRAKLRHDKCQFFARKVKYLGHMVSKDGYEPTDTYKQKILQFTKPTNKPKLHSFLGMVGWLIKFIPNIAQLTAPLHKMLHKDVKFDWGDLHDYLFERIQHAVDNAYFLHHPDIKKRFFVQTDASEDAYGAVIFQYGDDGSVKPIEFLSRTFKGAELNWHASEKEAFAVLQACKKWYKLLIPDEFTVLTDHKNLEVLLNSSKKFHNRRLTRWAVFLQELRIKCTYLRGEHNIPADYLSRDIRRDKLVREENGDCIRVFQVHTRSMARREALEKERQGLVRALEEETPINELAHIPDHIPPPKEQLEKFAKTNASLRQRVPGTFDLFATVKWDEWFELDSFKEAQTFDDLCIRITLFLEDCEDPAKQLKNGYPAEPTLNEKVRKECDIIRDISRHKYYHSRGMLMYGDCKLVVPAKLQYKIMEYFHSSDFSFHQGPKRMKSLIKSRFY